MRRILPVLGLLAVVAAIAAPTASSFAFVEGWGPVQGTVGIPYSWQFKSYGGCTDHRFSVISGSLPPGLTLASSGVISGTPTASGTYNFWAEINDKCGSTPPQRPFSITIIPKLTVTSPSPLAPATVGTPYGVKLTADGGGSQSWSIFSGTLPTGLGLGADGTLSGTPTAALAAPVNVVVQVTDGSRTDTKTLSIDVVSPLAVTAPTLATGESGVALKPATATAAGGRAPYAWTLTGAPSWLTIDGATGAISGTPETGGTFPVQIAAKDAYGTTATVNASVVVKGVVTVKTARFATTRTGKLFRATLATTGGVGPFTWKATGGKFPVGIRLDRKTGVVSGMPRKAGVYTVTFTVTDALKQTSEKTLTLTVNAVKKKKTK